MPFLPISKEDRVWDTLICKSPEHDPPNMIVITKECIWMCPECGCRTYLYPNANHIVQSTECSYMKFPNVLRCNNSKCVFC